MPDNQTATQQKIKQTLITEKFSNSLSSQPSQKTKRSFSEVDNDFDESKNVILDAIAALSQRYSEGEARIEARIAKLEQGVLQQIDEIRSYVDRRIDTVEQKFDDNFVQFTKAVNQQLH